jgi:hypothetical protein
MSSSIPAARLYLYTALTALTAAGQDLEGWQATFGPPEAHMEERKVLALMGVESIATEDAVLGAANNQEESYSINVRMKVHDPSCNGDPAELQAIDAEIWSGGYDALRAVVNADRTLGGAINISTIVATAGEGESDESPVPALNEDGSAFGWVAFNNAKVLVRTRIT